MSFWKELKSSKLVDVVSIIVGFVTLASGITFVYLMRSDIDEIKPKIDKLVNDVHEIDKSVVRIETKVDILISGNIKPDSPKKWYLLLSLQSINIIKATPQTVGFFGLNIL